MIKFVDDDLVVNLGEHTVRGFFGGRALNQVNEREMYHACLNIASVIFENDWYTNVKSICFISGVNGEPQYDMTRAEWSQVMGTESVT